MSGLLYFIALNSLSIAIACLVARSGLTWAEPKPALRLRRGLVYFFPIWFSLIHGVMLVSGMLGAMRPDVALRLLAPILAVLLLLNWKDFFTTSPNYQRRIFCRVRPDLITFALLACFLLWSLKHVWLPFDNFSYDDRVYYASIPMDWLEQENLSLLSSTTYKQYFPLSSSLISAWFMLPWPVQERPEVLNWVGLTGWLMMLWACVSLYEMLQRLNVHQVWRRVAVLALCCNPMLMKEATHFADADLSMACLLFGGFASATPDSASRKSFRLRLLDIFVASLSVGLSLGVRAIVAVPALVTALVSLCSTANIPPKRSWPLFTAIWMFGFLLTGAYWYLRNLLLTGNPVFPFSIGPLPGISTFPQTRISELAELHGWGTTTYAWFCNGMQYFGLLGWLAAIGLVGSTLLLLANPPRARTAPRAWMVSALLIAAITLLAYLIQPFSGGMLAIEPSLANINTRYLWFVPILGLAVFAVLLNSLVVREAPRRLIAFLLAIVIVSRMDLPRHICLAIIAGGFLSEIVVWWYPASRRHFARACSRIPNHPAIVPGMIAMSMLLLAVRHIPKTALAENTPKTGIRVAIDKLPAGSRLASFSTMGGVPGEMLRGSRRQHQVVILAPDGTLSHSPPAESDLISVYPVPVPEISAAQFTENLERSGIDYVIILQGASWRNIDPYPQHRKWLEQTDARRIYSDSIADIWKPEKSVALE